MGEKELFLTKVELDRAVCEKAYADCKDADLRAKDIMNQYGAKLTGIPDIQLIFKKAINDSSINYSLSDFHKSTKLFFISTDKFKVIAYDLDKIKESKLKISDETFSYFVLHLYGSNFDAFINFFKPLAIEIQKVKKYSYTNKDGIAQMYKSNTKINSSSILGILGNYEKKSRKSLECLFKRNLRNKIAHEEYKIKEGKIYYNKTWIQRETVFKNIAKMGFLINKVQKFEYKQTYEYLDKILKLKLYKSEAIDFKKKYKIR